MNVGVAWATPLVQDVTEVELPAGATVADAVARSGLVARYGIDIAMLGFAIFGRRVRADAPLADGDRVELARPLQIDPKAARAGRARAKPPGKAPRRVKRPASR
jgi:putative ubiquitin-RnfH superfamily antitoxin RatB of RatAB toxin-antitoxin module